MGLFIGLMSGTSLDGIDAALVEIVPSKKPKLIEFITHPLPDSLRQTLLGLNAKPDLSLQTFCELQKSVADQFSQATIALLKQSGKCAGDIEAIGSHGQTIFHAPEVPMSLQIGHPAFIAKQTRIQTVADFRVDDMANNGQGAPLAPAFHGRLFEPHDVLVNIGGIANVTYIGGDVKHTFGFDTGPGNGLMDELCQTALQLPHDQNGKIAGEHPVDTDLLKKLSSDVYFAQPAPKSTGRETFNLDWVNQFRTNQSLGVVLSTLNQLTVDSICDSIQALDAPLNRILICGGGAHNQTLIQRMQAKLNTPISTTDHAGINADALEAMMCAWLAEQRLSNTPIALQSITGAKTDSVLGGIFHP